MLIIWCAADPAQIRKVIGPIVGRQTIPHRVEPDLSKVPFLQEGDVLLACGSKALALLTEQGKAPKGRTVTSLRDKPLPMSGGQIFVTFDPNIVSRDYARLPEIQWDTQLAIRKHLTGDVRPVLGEYRYVESFHEIIEQIETRYIRTQRAVPLAADIETTGLDEYRPGAYIISLSLTLDPGKADVIYFDPGECPAQPPADLPESEYNYWQSLWVQLHWLLTSEIIALRGANFKYDSRWIAQHWGIVNSNLKMDTMLVGSLLDENRSNSLKLHAKLYTQLGGYEDDMKAKYDMARVELIPKDDLLPYAGGDTDATYQVGEVFKDELLKDGRLTKFYFNVLLPSSKVFEKMERTGMCLDLPYFYQLKADLEVEIARLDKEMKAMIPRKLAIKYEDNFSLTRPALMKEFLFSKSGLGLKPSMWTEKSGEPSTAMDHLLSFQDDPVAKRFISLLQESNSASKTLGTFVVGFLKHLRSDNRFHPHYRLARGGFGGGQDEGAVTGRTSATDPAVQTIAKHTKWAKRLRRAYVPPPGKVILQIDYSQGELKITACLSEEPVMLQAYLDGKDLHAITAAALTGNTLEDFMLLPEDVRDELRSGGKAGNFGLIYGMMPPGFVAYAFSTYGVVMTEPEATVKREAFFALYSRLLPWHERSKATARKMGQVRSPLGRIRHLPLITSSDRESRSQAERQAINSPVQSSLSDMMQLAMHLIDREYGHTGEVEMFMMTHDACAFYVPEEDAILWAKRLKAIMDNLPLKELFGWDHQLPFTTDAEVSVPGEDGVMSLATLKKLKGL